MPNTRIDMRGGFNPRRPMPGEGQPKSAAADDEMPDMVEQASDDSFPASDPPSFTPTRAGRPSEKQSASSRDRDADIRRGDRNALRDEDRRDPRGEDEAR